MDPVITIPEGKTSFNADELKAIITENITTNVEKMVQPKIDSIVQERLARERGQHADYDDLKKFKSEHEKKTADDEKTRLEAEGKYEEALKGVNQKIDELSGVVTQKDKTIQDMTINNALTAEVVNNGGYLEESLAMLKSLAIVKEGVVLIKGKDENNLDKEFPIADGVKGFFEKRPHLVKANANAGGGDSGGGGDGGDGGGGGEGKDLESLNKTYQTQLYANNFKGAQETKKKIEDLMAAKGIPRASGLAL